VLVCVCVGGTRRAGGGACSSVQQRCGSVQNPNRAGKGSGSRRGSAPATGASLDDLLQVRGGGRGWGDLVAASFSSAAMLMVDRAGRRHGRAKKIREW
jgi:hypothetical protein